MRHLTRLTVVLALGIAGVASAQPSSYERAVAMIARRQATDDSIAAAGARTILLTHDAATPRAIVLLHGLTDSPGQFEELAHRLHDDGNNVFVPRFPLHGVRGGDVRTLSALTWPTWFRARAQCGVAGGAALSHAVASLSSRNTPIRTGSPSASS